MDNLLGGRYGPASQQGMQIPLLDSPGLAEVTTFPLFHKGACVLQSRANRTIHPRLLLSCVQ